MAAIDAFEAAWPGPLPDRAALELALTDFLAAAEVGPESGRDVDAFVGYVAARLDAAASPETQLEALRPKDLAIAFGCLHQDPTALAWFEDAVMSVIRSVAAGRDPSAADDAYQLVFCKLFLPADDGASPKIHAYDGQRELGPWLRTVARNGAADYLRGQQRQGRAMTPLEAEHVEQVGLMLDDQETSYLRETCWSDFKAALADAFADLEPRQRNVLRCNLRGLTADHIGRIYGVHRVTVARWLAAIRFALHEGTRDGLRRRLAGDDPAVDSILRMVELDLTASLTRLVGDTSTG